MPFEPINLTLETHHESAICISSTPPEKWIPIISSRCTFPGKIFDQVMLDLVHNPNFNTSWVFRADILFDTAVSNHQPGEIKGYDNIIGPEQHESLVDDELAISMDRPLEAHNPRDMEVHGFNKTRTIVRKMIARNPQRDGPLVQTCHFFLGNASSTPDQMMTTGPDKDRLVVYIPHVSKPEDVPFYHPKVQAIVFFFSREYISILYALFDPLAEISPRLYRTAYQLLQTLHKHGHGTAAGYVKRVHHDVLMPQARVQDTYTRLKTAHAKRLLDNWVEVTDPTKHVFEDLGIAAFLIERWRDMYASGNPLVTEPNGTSGHLDVSGDEIAQKPSSGLTRQPFPGFVDIGCGNGVLVEILSQEGWDGWGFDARRRKTWSTLSADTENKLKELILVPAPLTSSNTFTHGYESGDINGETNVDAPEETVPFHNGLFPHGTFLISNHADQLTGWTPILAALADYAPFMIIPCCSCDLSGARFRAPVPAAPSSSKKTATSNDMSANPINPPSSSSSSLEVPFSPEPSSRKQADSGAISKPTSASTYAGLVAWTARIAESLGYVVEREILRIPSTRNIALLGRHPREGLDRRTDAATEGKERNKSMRRDSRTLNLLPEPSEELSRKIDEILEGFGLGNAGGSTTAVENNGKRGTIKDVIASEWIKRALALRKGGNTGHY